MFLEELHNITLHGVMEIQQKIYIILVPAFILLPLQIIMDVQKHLVVRCHNQIALCPSHYIHQLPYVLVRQREVLIYQYQVEYRATHTVGVMVKRQKI